MGLHDIPGSVVFVDVETTGLSHDDRVVSLGAFRLNTQALADGRFDLAVLNILCNPGRPSHPAARKVHGYDDWFLQHQEPFTAQAETIAAFIDGGELVVAHNASFDLGFIGRELALARLPGPRRPVFCTMQHHRSLGRGSASLKALCSQIGIERVGERHGALEDAWLAMMIYLWQHGIEARAPFPEGDIRTPANLRPAPQKAAAAARVGTLEQLLATRTEPILRPALGIRMTAAPVDLDDEPEEEESVDLDGLAIGISYEDAAGQRSERTIRCHAIRLDGGSVYLDAWCLLRREDRTFRLDRVRAVTDYSTGEVIDDVARFFSVYVPTGWPDPWAARAAKRPKTDLAPMKLFQEGVKILMYLAMEDGTLHEAEYRLILDYAIGRLRAAGILDFDLEARSSEWIRNHVPSRRAAVLALGKVMGDPEHGAEIAHKIVDLIIADGNATDEEMAAAWKLVEAMERRERSG